MKIYIGIDSHGIKRTIGRGNTHTEALNAVQSKTLDYIIVHANADNYKTWSFEEKESNA